MTQEEAIALRQGDLVLININRTQDSLLDRLCRVLNVSSSGRLVCLVQEGSDYCTSPLSSEVFPVLEAADNIIARLTGLIADIREQTERGKATEPLAADKVVTADSCMEVFEGG